MPSTVRVTVTWESTHEIELDEYFPEPEASGEVHPALLQGLTPENASMVSATLQ